MADRNAPTEAERGFIASRLDQLETVMVAARPARGAIKGEAEPYLSAMFLGYPSVKADRDEADKMLRLYLSQLNGLPLFAIAEGCQAMMRRNSPFPPSVGELYHACTSVAGLVRAEIRRMTAILTAEVYATPTPDEREAMSVRIGAMLKGLKTGASA